VTTVYVKNNTQAQLILLSKRVRVGLRIAVHRQIQWDVCAARSCSKR